MRSRAVLFSVVVVVLGFPPAVLAHVNVVPPFLKADAPTVIRFEAPNERADRPMTVFAITVPSGMRATGGEPSGAWTAAVDGRTVTWRGGSLAPNRTATFALKVVGPPRAGTVRIEARQGYDDGGQVPWTVDLTATPPDNAGAKQNLGTAAIVGVVGVVVVAGSLLVLRRTRRGTLQER